MASHPRASALRRFSLGLCLTIACALPAGRAHAGDYDRNDVSGRSLGLLVLSLPIAGAPLGVLAHGVARKHNGFLVLGSELAAGVATDGRAVLTGGAVVGVESAADAWQPVRGYGEVGASVFWAQTGLFEALTMHVEGGVRYQLKAYGRPHLLLSVGLRLLTNFGRVGWAAPVALLWTFD